MGRSPGFEDRAVSCSLIGRELQMWICADVEGGHCCNQSSLRKVDTMSILSGVLSSCSLHCRPPDYTQRVGLIKRWIRAAKSQCQAPREREMSGAVCPPRSLWKLMEWSPQ